LISLIATTSESIMQAYMMQAYMMVAQPVDEAVPEGNVVVRQAAECSAPGVTGANILYNC
jgi:hypothetical protein